MMLYFLQLNVGLSHLSFPSMSLDLLKYLAAEAIAAKGGKNSEQLRAHVHFIGCVNIAEQLGLFELAVYYLIEAAEATEDCSVQFDCAIRGLGLLLSTRNHDELYQACTNITANCGMDQEQKCELDAACDARHRREKRD